MQDFNSKQSALFACLDDASKELKGTGLDQTHMKNYAKLSLERRQDGTVQESSNNSTYLCERQSVINSRMQRMRGKESLFKKPELPIGRCLKPRKTPDYQINPHKWKKYSLADVDISEQTNTAAAFTFLKQMDEQRCAAAELEDKEHKDDQKIEFKKSSKIKRNLNNRDVTEVPDAEVDKPKLKGSKLVMPEYVIGQKSHRDAKRNKSKEKEGTRAAGTLKLSHLDEEVEDDEDEDF